MITGDRGEVRNLINSELAGVGYYQPEVFGQKLLRTAQDLTVNDLQALDEGTDPDKYADVLAETNSAKSALCEFLKVNQEHKVWVFFRPSVPSQADSQPAEVTTYPSALDNLADHFHPNHIAQPEEDINERLELIAKGIREVKPSEFIQLCTRHLEQANELAEEIGTAQNEAKAIIGGIKFSDLSDMLTVAEFNELMAHMAARFNQVPISLVDPLTTQEDLFANYLNPFASKDKSQNDLITIPLGVENPTKLLVHEYLHAVLERMKVLFMDGMPRVRIGGLNYRDLFTWLNEALTESFTQYLIQRSKGMDVAFDHGFLKTLDDDVEQVYHDEIALLATLTQQDRSILSDGLRTYLGLPMAGENTPMLGKYLKKVGELLKTTYGADVMDLDKVYKNAPVGAFPQLLQLLQRITIDPAAVGLGSHPEARQIIQYLISKDFSPDAIAYEMLDPEVRELLDSPNPVVSFSKDGRRLGAYGYLQKQEAIIGLIRLNTRSKNPSASSAAAG